MPVYMTVLGLICMTSVAIALRLFWPRARPRSRRILILLFALLLLPAFLIVVAKWETTSGEINTALFWIRLFGYECCVVFFTLLRPRWLTCLIAAVLTLPLFFSSIIGRLGGALYTAGPTVHSLSGGYYLELTPWSSGPGRDSGADLLLFYRPPGSRFFRRSFVGFRLYDSQCRTQSTFATLNLPVAGIDVHCPPLTENPSAPPSGTELHYIIPPGARSPAIARGRTR